MKAISVDPKCVPALLNLSDIELGAGDLSQANALLDKALAAEPRNVEALTKLARVDLMQSQYDLAISAANSVHALPHTDFATIHFTAASAYEHEGKIQEAIAELELFLKESPQGANADLARKAIAGLRNNAH